MSTETTTIGDVEETTIATLNSLRQAAKDLAAEIGNIEIRKARMIGSLGDIENKAQELLANEAKRLGIPEGTAWQVTPEGKAITITPEQAPANG